jgi:hypothetical protein
MNGTCSHFKLQDQSEVNKSPSPGLVISTFGLAEIISCMPDGLVKIYIGYWQTCQYSHYDENTQFFYLLCSQFRQKASGWINKTLLLIKQHITYMNISRYANIDKFVNIRYIFLLASRAYSWLFQLAQMWKLLAPGVGLGDFLTPVVVQQHCVINLSVICGRSVVFSGGILSVRASKRNFAWRNKTALGPWGQTETSLKIEYLRSNKTLWISEEPHSLSHRHFILIFSSLFLYFQLFLVYLET